MCSTHQLPLQCAWRQLSSTFTFLCVEKGPRQSYHLQVAKISSLFGPSQGILPFLGWLPDGGFSRLAPTAPLGTLRREGSWQRQGTNTARKPRPSGTSSALERECLTGVAGGTADQPTQGTSRGFTAQVFGRTTSLPSHHASTLGDRQKPGTCLADLCCPVSPLPALDSFSRAVEFSFLFKAAFLKVLTVETIPL